jgi:hypothetical protein
MHERELSPAFTFGEKVSVDGDGSLTGTVCAIMFYSHSYVQYKVAWIHNGTHQEGWIDEYRLKAVT